jgi:hypothetical protein
MGNVNFSATAFFLTYISSLPKATFGFNLKAIYDLGPCNEGPAITPANRSTPDIRKGGLLQNSANEHLTLTPKNIVNSRN